jgi:hypothetical protein
MARDVKRVKIGEGDDLMRIVEEVRRDGRPRVLERDGERLAAIIDVDDLPKVIEARPSEDDITSAFRAFGSRGHIDVEALKQEIRQARRSGSRPAQRPA